MGKRGFTLIELLIVVAIIAILAAIAVPNFLEAQTRSKVSRVKADFRTLATAIESYRVDYGTYGPGSTSDPNRFGYTLLKEPIAYVTSIPTDPFATNYGVGRGYEFATGRVGVSRGGRNVSDLVGVGPLDIFVLESIGPDLIDDTFNPGSTVPWASFPPTQGGTGQFPMFGWRGDYAQATVERILELVYDPTNGTVSTGGVWRHGGHGGDTQVLTAFVSAISR